MISPDASVRDFVEAVRAQPAFADALRHHELLEAQDPVPAPLPDAYQRLLPVLAARGIDSLYSHQAHALGLLAAGADVVLATPTASGRRSSTTCPCSSAQARTPRRARSISSR